MTSIQLLTLLSKVQAEEGRFAFSFDVLPRKNIEDIKKKRRAEDGVYVENKNVVGGCSPEIEVPLNNRKCEIQVAITGALKPLSEFEEGEDIIEYNQALSECRRLLTLVPTYVPSAEGIATIKFKIGGKVKHTVTVHDVPVTKNHHRTILSSSFYGENPDACKNENQPASLSSDISVVQGTYLQYSSVDGDEVDTGSVREVYTSVSGEGHYTDGKAMAQPVPPRSLKERIERMNIQQRGPDVVPPDAETAYDRMLCNESLNTISWALTPTEANRLLIGLGVPNSIHSHNQKNHVGDVVSGNYESLRYWRNQQKSRRQQQEVGNQQLYEDLLLELDDIGRKDLKTIIKRALELNKKLEKSDLSHL